MSLDDDISLAREVIRTERHALEQLENSVGPAFREAIDLILAATGYVIVAGVGKSGHIGQKIAASLASTGTPAFFVHPTEASHGDLGMVRRGSVVLAISYSGESRELVDMLRFCKSNEVPVIAMTRTAESTLGRFASVVLALPAVPEACPNGLAPTSSTTMALALGDAVTVTLMNRRGFSREDFGQVHPGGKLGRSLQTARSYLSGRPAEMPLVPEDTPFEQLVSTISGGRKGCAGVIDAAGRLTGMVTDGDLRRAFLAGKTNETASGIMTRNPKTIDPAERIQAVIERMSDLRIGSAFVVEDGRPIGLIDLKDLLAEGYL